MKLPAPRGMYLGYLGWTRVFYRGLPGFMVGGAMTVPRLLLKRGIKQSEVARGLAMFTGAIGVALLFLSGVDLPRRFPHSPTGHYWLTA